MIRYSPIAGESVAIVTECPFLIRFYLSIYTGIGYSTNPYST